MMTNHSDKGLWWQDGFADSNDDDDDGEGELVFD